MVKKKRYSKNRGGDHRKKMREKNKKRFDQENNSGPRGNHYFFSYSNNMLGRAIEDSGVEIIGSNVGDLSNNLIDIGLPNSPRDKNGRYGVLYGPQDAVQKIIDVANKKKKILSKNFGSCEENSLEERLSILKESKRIVSNYEIGYMENNISTFNFKTLLIGCWMNCNDLGYYLHEILHPLIGLVYRESGKFNFVSENSLEIGYNRIDSVRGVSRLRYLPASPFGKPAKNKKPHELTLYEKENLVELLNSEKLLLNCDLYSK